MSWRSRTEVDVLSINCSSSHSKGGTGAWLDSITIVAMVLRVYSLARELPSIQGVLSPTLHAADMMGRAAKLNIGSWR